MEFISSWIANIILFIMLAAVVELLLPQSSMQKYVKLVLGLFMIVIILTPIFKFISLDPKEIIKEFENESLYAHADTQNSLKEKKIEIQAQQRAYILEQTAVQMEKYVEKELMNSFGYAIGEIRFDFEEDQLELPMEYDRLMEQMKRIVVILEAGEKGDVEPVREVVVQPVRSNEYDEFNGEQIIQFLSQRWGIDKEKIEIQVEGGNGGN
ncbi:stage III sporulation protein AF [Fervidibacillus halotolerans]|uniref:Stage III sporulation protein AF n=1 Tax=Fervidibacillus halotolerans TaxID=2980027 RepID=A0A9E8LXD8_9BACI|nr:stage III sporulation protein AF [Fervidibacillus halotolerans]WAA11427.1 stage III sporulation protein AF [Fervidibacillus halotolerans]